MLKARYAWAWGAAAAIAARLLGTAAPTLLVASITSLPLRAAPWAATSSAMAAPGTANRTASASRIAASIVVARAAPPSSCSSCWTSGFDGSRAPSTTWCPAAAHFLARVPPMLPEPITAICMRGGSGFRPVGDVPGEEVERAGVGPADAAELGIGALAVNQRDSHVGVDDDVVHLLPELRGFRRVGFGLHLVVEAVVGIIRPLEEVGAGPVVRLLGEIRLRMLTIEAVHIEEWRGRIRRGGEHLGVG